MLLKIQLSPHLHIALLHLHLSLCFELVPNPDNCLCEKRLAENGLVLSEGDSAFLLKLTNLSLHQKSSLVSIQSDSLLDKEVKNGLQAEITDELHIKLVLVLLLGVHFPHLSNGLHMLLETECLVLHHLLRVQLLIDFEA